MNFRINKKQIARLAVITCFAVFVAGCEYDVKDLIPPPDASFTITPVAGQVNRYLLTSTSTNTYRYDWDKGTGVYVQGKQVDTVYFPDKGNYTVKLIAYGQNGMDSATQTVNVANDDPAAITPFKILTGNSSKKWKLAPEAGALLVGNPNLTQVFWQNNVADLTGRSCLFNDEYTFNKTGSTMVFDSKGDFYVDEEQGVAHPAGMPA